MSTIRPPVIVVGLGPASTAASFQGSRIAAWVDNGYDLDTPEQGSAISVCASPRQPWSNLWRALRHVD